MAPGLSDLCAPGGTCRKGRLFFGGTCDQTGKKSSDTQSSYGTDVADLRLRALRLRALGRALDRGELIRLMWIAAQIKSDGEKATLLTQVAAVCPADDGVLSAYLGAVRGIGSSWEKERALRALLRKGGLSGAILGQVAGLARNNISSEQSRQNILEIVNRRP